MTPTKVLTALALIAIVSMFGCSDKGVYPGGFPNVVMNLRASAPSGSPGTPVSITASVSNVGTGSTFRWSGCDYWAGGMQYRILDSSDHQLYFSDPRFRKLCADFATVFPPGQTLTGTLMFDGIMYDSDGNLIKVPSGTYTVQVVFEEAVTTSGLGSYFIRQSVTFRWSAN